MVAHERVGTELAEKLGRGCLLLTHAGSEVIDVEAIAPLIRSRLPAIDQVADYLYHLPLDQMTPLLPKKNFQDISQHSIAHDAQQDWANFRRTMDSYKSKLYDPDYVNPIKKYMRGAFKLNARVGFQRDRLHDKAQLGLASRSDYVHLINAHHLFGAVYVPGRHFDVTAADGRGVGCAFKDILNGGTSETTSTHENITPCDRVLGL